MGMKYIFFLSVLLLLGVGCALPELTLVPEPQEDTVVRFEQRDSVEEEREEAVSVELEEKEQEDVLPAQEGLDECVLGFEGALDRERERNAGELPNNIDALVSELTGEYWADRGYLCYGSERLFEEAAPPVLGDGNQPLVHFVEKENYAYLFFNWVAGCGGCGSFAGQYVAHNLETNEAEIIDFEDAQEKYLFERGTESQMIFQPNGTQVTYVKVEEKESEYELYDESVWLFDLLTQEDTLVQRLPENKRVVNCIDTSCSLIEGTIVWEDNEIMIDPRDELFSVRLQYTWGQPSAFLEYCNSNKGTDCHHLSFETEHGARITHNIGDSSFEVARARIAAVDFNGDDTNEYLLWFSNMKDDYFYDELGQESPKSAYYVAVYRFDGNQWTNDVTYYVGEKYESVDAYYTMDERAFTRVSTEDSSLDIQIQLQGNGGQKDMLLRWDGEKVVQEVKDIGL